MPGYRTQKGSDLYVWDAQKALLLQCESLPGVGASGKLHMYTQEQCYCNILSSIWIDIHLLNLLCYDQDTKVLISKAFRFVNIWPWRWEVKVKELVVLH